MKLNKMTLAAVVTIGVLAGTNAGFTQSEMSSELVAACPLSDCPSPVTPKTAVCPKCHKHIDKCSCGHKTDCTPCQKAKSCDDDCKKYLMTVTLAHQWHNVQMFQNQRAQFVHNQQMKKNSHNKYMHIQTQFMETIKLLVKETMAYT